MQKIKMFSMDEVKAPWGDYGSILTHGMTRRLGRKDGKLQLERTGPYIPPVSISGIHDIIVTDSVRQKVLKKIPELLFRPIIKARIVHLDWHLWDRSAKEPVEYPENGEPEDYILERKHDSKLSSMIGHLYELVPVINEDIQVNGSCAIILKHYKGEHLICADDFAGCTFISEPLKEALNEVANEYLVFTKARHA